MYGTLGYMQMLDDEAASLNFDRQERLKEERLSPKKKCKLLEELETKELHVMHDHAYTNKPVDLNTM